MAWTAVLGSTTGLSGLQSAAATDAYVTLIDSSDDAVARRSDPGADGVIDAAGLDRIELLQVRIGPWSPLDPYADLFSGAWNEDGEFFRLEIELAGLVNPPGPARPSEFNPRRFGDRPIFGFIEIDVDGANDTGGELEAPRYRYTGNAARFGGFPADASFQDRIALDASAFDSDFQTAPYVERHGEEFHLAFLEEEIRDDEIEHVVGDEDFVFEAGETWRLDAELFHRAHGFEDFSLVYGGDSAGRYEPDCVVEFRHDLSTDITRVSLVYQLTDVAAGWVEGNPPEPIDYDAANQTSVLEALSDLRDSAEVIAQFPTGQPEENIILEWRNRTPEDYLDPRQWRVTALLGAGYVAPQPEGEFFVWTDIFPEVLRGDVTGDGVVDENDREEIQEFISEEDNADGVIDGRVVIADFGLNFSVFDLNHDGVVDPIDLLLAGQYGDSDDDGDVDLQDFAALQGCVSAPGEAYSGAVCALVDLDADGDVDGVDTRRWLAVISGPTP